MLERSLFRCFDAPDELRAATSNITKYSIFYSTYLFFIQVVPKNTSSISNMFFVVVIRFIVVEVLYCMELLSIL
jgi:hypothetical protein